MTRRVGGAERGSATLELIVLAPALLLLIALVITVGQVTVASGAVAQAASIAARQASLARTPDTARAQATQAAVTMLTQQGVPCTTVTVQVDTTGFTTPVGTPATVTAHVECTVALASMGLGLLPGARALSATESSALDRYRTR